MREAKRIVWEDHFPLGRALLQAKKLRESYGFIENLVIQISTVRGKGVFSNFRLYRVEVWSVHYVVRNPKTIEHHEGYIKFTDWSDRLR